MSSGEDGRGVGGDRGMEPLGAWWERVDEGIAEAGGRDSMGEETLAREADQNRALESVERAEVGEEGVVFAAEFAEAEAGVEDDAIRGNAGACCGPKLGAEFVADEGFDRGGIKGLEGVPNLRGPAGMHEDEAGRRVSIGEGLRH